MFWKSCFVVFGPPPPRTGAPRGARPETLATSWLRPGPEKGAGYNKIEPRRHDVRSRVQTGGKITHICTLTYKHECIYRYTFIQLYLHTYLHIHMYTCTPTLPTYRPTYLHTCVHSYTQHMHTYTYPYVHAHVHVWVYVCMVNHTRRFKRQLHNSTCSYTDCNALRSTHLDDLHM